MIREQKLKNRKENAVEKTVVNDNYDYSVRKKKENFHEFLPN